MSESPHKYYLIINLTSAVLMLVIFFMGFTGCFCSDRFVRSHIAHELKKKSKRTVADMKQSVLIKQSKVFTIIIQPKQITRDARHFTKDYIL